MDSIKKMSEYRIMNKELRNSKFSVRRSIFLSRYTCARIDMEMKRPGGKSEDRRQRTEDSNPSPVLRPPPRAITPISGPNAQTHTGCHSQHSL